MTERRRAELRGDVTELRGIRQDVAGLHQGLAMLGRRVDSLDQRVQANGVLLEALRDEVRQIAEAYVLLDQRVERYRVENDAAHREILALLHTSYRDLDRRLTRLEERAGEAGRAMNRHAGPPRADDGPAVPEPTFAERARTLAHLGRTGTLATLSRKHPGHPFASSCRTRSTRAVARLFLISTMAMHTHNLQNDPRASLLVTQPDWSGDPLAAGRLTLMGEARRLEAGETAEARAAYLARHERAAYWVDFDDFGFWRLEVLDVYFVGGFAAMDWVTAADYAAVGA